MEEHVMRLLLEVVVMESDEGATKKGLVVVLLWRGRIKQRFQLEPESA